MVVNIWDNGSRGDRQVVAEIKHIVLTGAGGCMRELIWQIRELNKVCPTWQIDGYVDIKAPEDGEQCVVGNETIPYLGTDDYLLEKEEFVNVAVCAGNPGLRKKIVTKLKKNENIQFPNLILGDTRICDDVKMGEGCIVSMDCRISTNVILGDFVFMNTGSKICHDGDIGDFVTLSPDVCLAGNVRVESEADIGLGAKVIQGVNIGASTVIGAGSVVVRDMEASCTAVGVPAKKIKER